MVRVLSLFGLALLLAVAPPGATMAQPAAPPAPLASPSLTARVAGVDTPEAESRKLQIERLDIAVRLHGTVAETTMTARFRNASDQQLEGDFQLAMPAASVVTGYALDINGVMVDGILADQRQARLAYEARVRQRIDPGLAEVGRDNLFRTRVFPILPNSGRTIRLRFVTPLDPRTGYVLPLRKTERIGALSLAIEASGVAGQPALQLPAGFGGSWGAGSGLRFAAERRDLSLDGDLVIAPPRPAGTMLVARHDNGERFFQIADAAPAMAGAAAAPVRRLALLWDRSLSRADDALEQELELVDAYLERVRPAEIELLLFDSGRVERVRAAGRADALRRLRDVRYRGATSYAALARERLEGVDACLMFSDGLPTIDRREDLRPACPLSIVSSAADADRASLAALARGSGGEAYDLSVRGVDEVLARMTRQVPRVAAVRTAAGQPIDFTLLDGGESGWRIVGPMPASGDVVVRFSGLAGEVERVYRPAGAVTASNGPGALWAAERSALLAARDDIDRAALLAHARSYSVASPEISFVVLDTGRDYAMARFEPPANLPAALLDEYRRARDDMKRQETEARGQRLNAVLTQWQELRTWHGTRFDPRRAPPRGSQVRPQSGPVPIAPPPPVVAPPP
jgi:hypothetical protein